MKSVSSRPVTNHFSPLRTYSPVAASRTAVAREGPGVGAGAVLGDRVAARALAAQRTDRGSAAAAPASQWTQRVVGARDVRPQAAGRPGRAARGRGPARATVQPWPPTSTGQRAAVQAGLDRGPPDRVAPVARRRARWRARTRPRAAGGRRGRRRGRAPGARAGPASGSGPSPPRMRARRRGAADRRAVAGARDDATIRPRGRRPSPAGRAP